MSAARSLTRSSVHAFASSVCVVLVALAISVVIARALGAQGKGNYDLAFSTATILTLFLGLSLPTGITYSIARRSSFEWPLIGWIVCGGWRRQASRT